MSTGDARCRGVASNGDCSSIRSRSVTAAAAAHTRRAAEESIARSASMVPGEGGNRYTRSKEWCDGGTGEGVNDLDVGGVREDLLWEQAECCGAYPRLAVLMSTRDIFKQFRLQRQKYALISRNCRIVP